MGGEESLLERIYFEKKRMCTTTARKNKNTSKDDTGAFHMGGWKKTKATGKTAEKSEKKKRRK